MALEAVDHPGISVLEGVRFPMKSNGEIVSILVTHEALQDIASPPPEEDGYLDRLREFRPTFEAIASKKFHQGVNPIVITSADVAS